MWEEIRRKILETVEQYLNLEKDYVRILVEVSSRLDRL